MQAALAPENVARGRKGEHGGCQPAQGNEDDQHYSEWCGGCIHVANRVCKDAVVSTLPHRCDQPRQAKDDLGGKTDLRSGATAHESILGSRTTAGYGDVKIGLGS